jgi:translation initiation factor IF-2
MTEDKKAIRLSKAAREFNVGIQTIVEFLHKKGFEISHDPNCKIPPEAYVLIVKEYSSDLSVKKDAEKIALKEKITPKKSLSSKIWSRARRAIRVNRMRTSSSQTSQE